MKNPLHVATITSPHGVRGLVKIHSFTEDPEGVLDYGVLSSIDGQETYELELKGYQKRALICALEGVNTRNKAEAIQGLKLYVDREILPKIEEEDEFYANDLVGLQVITVTTKGKQINFGVVHAVHDYGAGDLIEMTMAQNGKNTLVAFTKANFPEVSIADGVLVYNPPEIITAQDEDGNVH